MMLRMWIVSAMAGATLCASFVHAQNDGISTATDETRSGRGSGSGFFVEPILQASREESQIMTSQLPLIGDDTSGTTEGYGVGARFGVHLSEIFFVGADGRYAKTRIRDSSYETADGDLYNYGPTVGVQMPVFGLRLLGTYVMGGEFNPGAGAQGVDLRFGEARGSRLGVGIRLAAVSVNLEYQDLVYDSTDIQSFGGLPGNAASDVDFENKGYTLSLSFPIEL